MSEENVELVRRTWDLWQEGPDSGDFGAAWDRGLAADECKISPPREMLAFRGHCLVGRDGFVEFNRVWTTDVFKDWTISPERFIDAGDKRVVVIVNQSATGKGSGVPVELRSGMLYIVENDQITSIDIYTTAEEALEVAGLSE